MEGERNGSWVTIAAAVTVLSVPVFVDLALGRRREFGYLAMDVFYYLTIARNRVEVGEWSFDGQFPTNGYHPLWQWLLAPLHAMLEGLGTHGLLVAMIVIGIGMIAGALVLLGRALTHADGRLGPLFPLLVPGATALLSTPLYQPTRDSPAFHDPAGARPIITTLWSYANGMETPLLLLAFAAALLYRVRHPLLSTWRQGASYGLLLLLLSLARIDHVCFALAFLLSTLVDAWRVRSLGRDALRNALLAGACLLGGVLVYLLYNRLAFASWLPVSGTIKSSFPWLRGDAFEFLAYLLLELPERWVGTSTRLVQLLLPMLVALLLLLRTLRLRASRPWLELRPERSPFDALLGWLAAATLLLGAYNTCFVSLFSMGHWYFPVSTLLVSIVCLRALDRWPLRRPRLWLALSSCASVLYFPRAQYRPLFLADEAAFVYDEAPRVRDGYAARGFDRPRIVEFDDGIITYATGFPALSGFGMALDAEALRAARRGGLMELAIARGHDRIASFHYVHVLTSGPHDDALVGQAFRWISPRERERLRFHMEYHSLASGFAVFRVSMEPATEKGSLPATQRLTSTSNTP